MTGPPAVFLVGFRLEETPYVRLLLDQLGGVEVPVVPLSPAELHMPLAQLLREFREPDW